MHSVARMIYTNTGRQSVGLLALRVTENASRAGEHYITETRSEYFAMWRSALVQVSSWLLWPCRSFISANMTWHR